ncbi:MAG TPA: hypothetical protein DD381_06700 [Lentisphaeria bacterium]|nr:MAG: hypothetical protein A2X47_13085 [Lentisphaerae bacterium GWF2_38_69]HBM16013.1 hypothetical protein [Lentisphaeria bacterium]
MNKDKILSLISLLDDENENTSSFAIKELLSEGKKALGALSEFQESVNPIIRKRVHQIQAIHLIRKSRDILVRRLTNRHSGLWNGLLEIHLAWFDRDTKENINALFAELLNEFSKLENLNSKSLANFMRMMGFVMPIEGDIDPEYYCVGSVLESKIGSDSVLSAIAYKLLIESGKEAKLIRYKNITCLIMDGDIINPESWKTESEKSAEYETLDPGQVMRYTMLKLFLATICSESYRYTYTIGKCLKKSETAAPLPIKKNENLKAD